MYDYYLPFKLTLYQSQASQEILDYLLNKEDVLLDAVCGAGKTEIVLETIKTYLNIGLIIGFACPRKVLLCDLFIRISQYFKSDKFGLVYGDKSYQPQAQLVFLTTHQLYKYKKTFDLLIIDEIDAFPYCDNFKLENDAALSSKQFLYISATVPSKYYQTKIKHVKLYHRHHLKVLPIPEIINVHQGRMYYELLKLLKTSKDPYLVFCQSKKQTLSIHRLLKLFRIKSINVDSTNMSVDKLDLFKEGKIKVMVSTTVLERGITLKGLNVIVMNAENRLYTKSVLVQIAGRVGRDYQVTTGLIIYLCNRVTNDIKDSIDEIKMINHKIIDLNNVNS